MRTLLPRKGAKTFTQLRPLNVTGQGHFVNTVPHLRPTFYHPNLLTENDLERRLLREKSASPKAPTQQLSKALSNLGQNGDGRGDFLVGRRVSQTHPHGAGRRGA